MSKLPSFLTPLFPIHLFTSKYFHLPFGFKVGLVTYYYGTKFISIFLYNAQNFFRFLQGFSVCNIIEQEYNVGILRIITYPLPIVPRTSHIISFQKCWRSIVSGSIRNCRRTYVNTYCFTWKMVPICVSRQYSRFTNTATTQ